MAGFRDLRIKHKLSALILSTTFVALGLAVISFMGYDVFKFRQERVKTLTMLADVLAGNSTAALSFDDPETATEVLSALKAEPNLLSAALYARDGSRLATYQREGWEVPPPDTAPQVDQAAFEAETLSLARPVMLAGKQVGVIFIVSDTQQMRRRLLHYAEISGLVFVVCLLAAAGVSTGLQRLISGPIEVLAATAKRATKAGDYTVHAEKQGDDELGQLTDAFNEMLATIEARRRALQEAHDSLDERVKERTAQLESTNAELERSNRELGQFAYVASHDLKEPLRVVTSYCELLGSRFEGKLDEKGERYLQYITTASKRMRQLISDLLDYSRVGTRGVQLAPIELGEALDEALSNLRVAVTESKAQIVRKKPLPMVLADAGQLVQLLQNLISNAIKFCEVVPRIEVSARPSPKVKDRWEIRITDNGPGIAPEFQEQIFSIFQRLEAGHKIEGTGIGLAVCRRILERHGGEIQVESQAGGGATFFFDLAKAPPA